MSRRLQLRNIIVRLNHPTGRLSYRNICDAVRATGVELDQQVTFEKHYGQHVASTKALFCTHWGLLCEQDELTLTRTLDPLKKGIIPSYRLIKKLEAAPVM